MNAYKMDMESSLNYNINKFAAPYNLKDSFRLLKIIKNRLSRDNIAIGLLFLPKAGAFKELPHADEMSQGWLERNMI